MSLNAMLWALNDAPVDDPTTCLVLIGLADNANSDGTGAYPSVQSLAQRARCSPRTVQRHLRDLQEANLIRPGDQGLAARHRGDRRPTVYDLNLGKVRGDNLTPRTGDGVSRTTERGDTEGTNGVSPVSYEPTTNPTTTVLTPDAVASDLVVVEPLTDKQQAQALVKAYWEGLEAKPLGKNAYWSSITTVTGALKQYGPEQIADALTRLTGAVTPRALELALGAGVRFSTGRERDEQARRDRHARQIAWAQEQDAMRGNA